MQNNSLNKKRKNASAKKVLLIKLGKVQNKEIPPLKNFPGKRIEKKYRQMSTSGR